MTAWYNQYPLGLLDRNSVAYQELYTKHQETILDIDTSIHKDLFSQAYIDALLDLHDRPDFTMYLANYGPSFKAVMSATSTISRAPHDDDVHSSWNFLNAKNITQILKLPQYSVDIPNTLFTMAYLRTYLDNQDSIPCIPLLYLINNAPDLYQKVTAGYLQLDNIDDLKPFTQNLLRKIITNKEVFKMSRAIFKTAFENFDYSTLSTFELAHVIQNVYHLSTSDVLLNRSPTKNIDVTMAVYLDSMPNWPQIHTSLRLLQEIKLTCYLDFDLIYGVVDKSIIAHPTPTFGF